MKKCMNMKYLGIGGMQVSQFALGTWHLPPSNEKYEDGIYMVDAEKTRKIFQKAVDLGINFFDTANTYHGTISETDAHPEHSGNAEKILGSYLQEIERESVVIATKVRAEVASFPNGGGLSRKHITWQVRESLRRLRTDYIDLYQIHWEDNMTPPKETVDILNDLVHRGLVHYTGTSNHSPLMTRKMIEISHNMGWETFSTMQESYNILDREFEKEKAKIALDNNMVLLAYVPLAEGILTGKYISQIPSGTRATYTKSFEKTIKETKEKVSAVYELAKNHDISMSQLSLAWILKMQSKLGIKIVPILGATDVHHLEENILSMEVSLSNDEMNELNLLSGMQV